MTAVCGILARRSGVGEKKMRQESTSEEVKEVYCQFGLAYYHSEVLHRGLCNLYALSQIPEEGGLTRPRLEEHLVEAYSSTLGRIVDLVLPLLPDKLINKLRDAIRQRNFLAHHFWFERIHLTSTSEGVVRLIEELSRYSKTFRELDSKIQKLTTPVYPRIGLTDDALEEALNAVRRGEDMEPLWRQRRPRKEEAIVGAYEVPTKSGRSTLVFKTEDGCFWQLCDAGLGWTFHDRIESGWKPIEGLSNLLPARVNPRPQIEKPWYYELSFGDGVSLVVRPGRSPNIFRWQIGKRGAQQPCRNRN